MFVQVYIRRRPADGVAYATIHDFSKFVMEPPLEVLTVAGDVDVMRCENVRAALAKYNVDSVQDLM